MCRKLLILGAAIALALGFAYHVYHNLKEDHAGRETRPTQVVPVQLQQH